MTTTTIFEGNLDLGFKCSDLNALPCPSGGWDVFPVEEGATLPDRIGWFATVVEALRYLGARDAAWRSAQVSQELLRWGITEKKRSQANG